MTSKERCNEVPTENSHVYTVHDETRPMFLVSPSQDRSPESVHPQPDKSTDFVSGIIYIIVYKFGSRSFDPAPAPS